MKLTLAFTLSLAAIASFPSVASAGEIFDGPGRGYREQAERISPAMEPSGVAQFKIGPVLVPSGLIHRPEGGVEKPEPWFVIPPSLVPWLSNGGSGPTAPKSR